MMKDRVNSKLQAGNDIDATRADRGLKSALYISIF